MKIVILDGYTENPGDLSWSALEALGELTVYDRSMPAEVPSRIGGAEAVFTNKVVVDRSVMDKCPNLKFIGVLATGYNVVDIQAAKEKGIVVSNIPAYSTDSVAQHTIALLLEICHHVGHHSDAVRSGRWESCPDFCFWDFPLIELRGKTFGIIGLGNIGMRTAELARALGMHVIAYAPRPTPAKEAAAELVSLDELFARSDVLSLHCPLNAETQDIIRKENIDKMKDGVIILNNGRGPLIVEQDLADALNSGKVYAAGVDVVSVEPISGDNPLLTAKNCFITPHIAWASHESRARLMDIAVGNLQAFQAGAPVNVVNP